MYVQHGAPVYVGMDMVVMTGPQLNYFRTCKFLHLRARVCVISDTCMLSKGVYMSVNQVQM